IWRCAAPSRRIAYSMPLGRTRLLELDLHADIATRDRQQIDMASPAFPFAHEAQIDPRLADLQTENIEPMHEIGNPGIDDVKTASGGIHIEAQKRLQEHE